MTTIYLHLSPYSGKTPADLIGMSQEQLSGLLHYSAVDKVGGEYLGVPYMNVGAAECGAIQLHAPAEIVATTVATMRARQQTVRAEAQLECTRIDTAISKLLAIEHSIPTGEARDSSFGDFEDARSAL
jgi:hypothetical protein